ncbi:MAG: RsmD family RNA methyltransferase [Clostridia bacterium]|nr:RsmD family RNA methyltransferase [Clostridia bacterium]
MEDKARLIPRDYRQAMDMLSREKQVFDVIFLDPPYRMENTGEMCAELYDKGLLAKAFLVVVEHKRGLAPLVDERFEAFDQRNYGDTQITLIRSAVQEDAQEDAQQEQFEQAMRDQNAEGDNGREDSAVSGEL